MSCGFQPVNSVSGLNDWYFSDLRKALYNSKIEKLDITACNLNKIFDVYCSVGTFTNKKCSFEELKNEFKGQINENIKELKIQLNSNSDDNEYYLNWIFCTFEGLNKLTIVMQFAKEDSQISKDEYLNSLKDILMTRDFSFKVQCELSNQYTLEFIKS